MSPLSLHPVTLTVDQAAILLYAQITDDFNPIHVDPEFAATTPLGQVIAHGMLSANLIIQAIALRFGTGLAQHARHPLCPAGVRRRCRAGRRNRGHARRRTVHGVGAQAGRQRRHRRQRTRPVARLTDRLP